MKNNMEYPTRDFYIGACILASGANLLRLEKETSKIVTFIFEISPPEAEKIIQRHWNRELLLPTRNLIEAVHELKTRIYAHQ